MRTRFNSSARGCVFLDFGRGFAGKNFSLVGVRCPAQYLCALAISGESG
ncbi:hypothetical protein HMPREF0577_0046 [Mobiluncus mulieris ATCC 35243]|nr:hypothetical protein HMPREF0577_0046 [Mobiluncus mulieris ATCC 35243]